MRPLIVVCFIALTAFSACEARNAFSLGHKLLHREPPVRRSAADESMDARRIVYQYMEQRVDNFDNQNFATYQQAYFENDQHFADNGPLFIFVGGEWEIHPVMVQTGHMFDMAAELNGSLFYPEHRYYGHSFPTEDLSIDNLRFLSVEQALADLANFIVQIKRRQPRYARSPVVLVGGSYSATMVAWFRKQYPHLAVGAWASSAPVLAKVDFVEYKEIVGASIASLGGQRCYDRLERAFAQIERVVGESPAEFREQFGFCADFGEHALDVPNAISTLTDVLAGIVQYHADGDIQGLCEQLLKDETTTDIAAFAQFFRSYVNLIDDECIDNYQTSVAELRNVTLTSLAASDGMRQWLYQTCTEFGWYQTSGSEYQPFGSSFPVDLYYQMCADIYGHHITQQFMHAAVDRTNVVFGGWQLDVSNVYFTHGLIDPWRAMGIQEDLNGLSPADVIPGASHVDDLSSISETDSEEMQAAKRRIRLLVWLWTIELAN